MLLFDKLLIELYRPLLSFCLSVVNSSAWREVDCPVTGGLDSVITDVFFVLRVSSTGS